MVGEGRGGIGFCAVVGEVTMVGMWPETEGVASSGRGGSCALAGAATVESRRAAMAAMVEFGRTLIRGLKS